MRIIHGNCLAELHRKAVEYVMKTGWNVTTEDGEETTQADAVTLVCKKFMTEPRIAPESSYKKMFCDEYSRRLINGYDKDTKFAYDYHSRLFGEFEEDNQIKAAIERLAEHPESRRAVAVTWRPCSDMCAKNIPCLLLVQFSIVHGSLNMTAVFRSNDMLSAFGENAYALTELQRYARAEILEIWKAMAEQKGGCEIMNLNEGTYTHISLIPHVYHVRDAEELKRFTLKNKI